MTDEIKPEYVAQANQLYQLLDHKEVEIRFVDFGQSFLVLRFEFPNGWDYDVNVNPADEFLVDSRVQEIARLVNEEYAKASDEGVDRNVPM